MHCKCKLVNYSIKRNIFVTVHPYQCTHVKELESFEIWKTKIGLDRFFGFFSFFVKHLLIFFTLFCCLASESCLEVQNVTKYFPQALHSARVPTPLGDSAHWPLPLLEQLWPACSSDPQCYCQAASQWKIPPHFLGFTNTVWNKKPLSALRIIHRVNWRENKCIVHLDQAVKTR